MITIDSLIKDTEERVAQDRQIKGLFESHEMQFCTNNVPVPHEVSAAQYAEYIAKDEELLNFLKSRKDELS